MKRIIVLLAALAAIAAGAWTYINDGEVPSPVIRTVLVSTGPVVEIVQGTGTVGAVTTVNVGTQVSGVISRLGADFNSTVKKGQVIAKLDPALLQAQVLQARASVTRAGADLQQQKVNLADRQTKYERAEKLSEKGLVAESDLEAAKLAVDLAGSDLESGQAAVVQAEASLNQAEVNLSHAVITSPIDGIVIQRSVDVGQTVAASLSSPEIFLIAADLTAMQVVAQVDETDIAKVSVGQQVSLSVDAFPNQAFTGAVSQIRLQPQVVSNVTTYSTIVDVPNRELKLKPGMTADVKIEIARRDDVLRVPNAALRFRPTPEIFAMLGQAPPAQEGKNRPGGQVWVLDHGQLHGVPVTAGLADAAFTELVESDLPPGTALVTSVAGDATTTRTAPAATNPLVATPRGGRGR
jgi:HlyD family secretion protein